MNEKGFFTHQAPKKYRDAELNALDKRSEAFKEFGRKWAKDPKSLFIYGNKGTGKTRYAFALIREMFRTCPRHIWPRYFTSMDLSSRLHEAVMNGGDKYLLSCLSTEDLLLIDDFGRESSTDRTRRQLFEIINYRYADELPTVITSNFSLEELSLSHGEALASRMEEWQLIKFKGEDLRKQIVIE